MKKHGEGSSLHSASQRHLKTNPLKEEYNAGDEALYASARQPKVSDPTVESSYEFAKRLMNEHMYRGGEGELK